MKIDSFKFYISVSVGIKLARYCLWFVVYFISTILEGMGCMYELGYFAE